MKDFILLIGLLLVLVVSCAPIPNTSEVSPEVKGYVVNAITKTPIANAKLFYEKVNFRDKTKSDDDGSFSIGPLNQWHYLLFIGSPGQLPAPVRYAYINEPGIIIVKAKGYENGKYDVYIDGKKHENIIIKLSPIHEK